MLDTRPLLFPSEFPPIQRSVLETLQVNLGYRCNQSCVHCHVDAGPKRTEVMRREVVDEVLGFLRDQSVGRLDLTGGAPELNPHFRYLVAEAVALGVRVIDRCNLSVLVEPGQEDLAEFLARYRVEVTASLPCYLEENVDAQRGRGVFAASIAGLRRLNDLGYGEPHGGRVLNLVYNPQGPSLPPPQCALEADYRRYLFDGYGVRFNTLLTLTNMPIRRFGSLLLSRGQFHDYLGLLKASHRDENLGSVMCRSLLSVDWQGYVYDCDFNQMLDLPLRGESGGTLRLSEVSAARLTERPIRVGEHCFGCTAGQGSSCGGALVG
jgi:radical SAM/Cys-rich protein